MSEQNKRYQPSEAELDEDRWAWRVINLRSQLILAEAELKAAQKRLRKEQSARNHTLTTKEKP